MPSLSFNALLRNRYGGRRALLASARANVLYRLGALRAVETVDWARVDRVVFICRGNVCRSPLAEFVAGRAGLVSTSFGLVTDQGTVANATAVRIAFEMGLDMSQHRSRLFTAASVRRGDLLLGMEPSHLEQMRSVAPAPDVQMSLLGLMGRASKTPYLHDPYGLPDSYFRRCFEFIAITVGAIADDWRRARGIGIAGPPQSRPAAEADRRD